MSKSKIQDLMDYFDNEEEEEIEDNNKTGSEGYFNQANNKINSDNEKNEEEEKNDIDNLYESIEEESENEENEENEKKESENIYNDEDDNNIYSNEESFKPTKPPSKSNLNNSNLTKEYMNDLINQKINNDDDDSFLAEQEKRRQERLKKEKEEEKINQLNEKNEKIKESLKKKKEQIEEMVRKKKEENLNELRKNIKKDNDNNNNNDNNDNNNNNNSDNNNEDSNEYINDYNNNNLNIEIQSVDNDNNTSKHSSISSNYNLEQKKEKLESLVKQKQNEKKKLEEEKKILQKNNENKMKNNKISINNENNNLNNLETNYKISEKNTDNNLIKTDQPKIKNSLSSINKKKELTPSENSFSDKKKKSQNTIKSFLVPVLYNNKSQFTFHPKIDQNSKKIVNECINKSNTYRSLNKSIDNILYDDAKRKKNKLKKLENDKINEAILNSSKSKINNYSHNLAINNLEKKIEKTVKLYDKDDQISFIGIVKVLYDLKILKEILKKDKYYDNTNNDMSEEEILNSIRNKYNNRRRNDDNNQNGISIEVELLEQIWFLLNTSNQEYIDSNTFINFLIILFTPVNTTIKEIVEILNKYIQATLFIYNDLNSFSEESSNYSSHKNSSLISKITGNYFSSQDKWELEKIIKTFWSLKRNRLAYINTHKISKSTEKDLKEINKNLTFQPNYDSNNNNIPKVNFLKKLKKYEEEEKLKQLILNKQRKNKELEETKELQDRPNIELSSKKYRISKNKNEDIHNTLYEKAFEKISNQEKKIQEIQEKEEEKFLNECTFEPLLTHSIDLNKSFDIKRNIKGYGKFIERMRSGILSRQIKNYNVNKIPKGEKYNKEKLRNIKPFNITDLKNQKKKEKKKLMKINNDKVDTKKNNKKKSNIQDIPSDNSDYSDGTTPYLILDIKLLTKKRHPIKIYVNDNPHEIAENFGKNYNCPKSIIDKLSSYIERFQKEYLNNEKNNNDDNIINS